MLEKFLGKTRFDDYQDFMANFKVLVPEDFNFGYDVVDAWASAEPDRKALLWTNEKGEERQFTFGELKELTDATASYFQSLGIGRGDKVMLILKRRFHFWLAIIAIHKLGAIVIPATHLLTAGDIEYRCNRASIKAIVAVGDQVVLDHVDEAMAKCPTVDVLISSGPIVPEGWSDMNRGIEEAAPFVRPDFVNHNDDTMLIYFTSGTSGEPKMVAHDFTYPLGHIITASYWHNLTPGSLHFTLADTGWGKAVWGKLYGQWIAGANVFVYDYEKFQPVDVLHKIQQYGISSFCAPPTVFRFLIREDLSKFDISTLKYCTIAGEALNPKVFEEWKRLTGIQLMEGFGQTETTLTVGTYPWVEPRPGSMGVANPQYDIDLVKPDGTKAAPGEQGELVIHVENGKPLGMFKEYHDDPELTRQAIHDGLYYTSDVAIRDEDGYFWFVGRTDDVIKSSGYRIGPFEVESAVMTHPAVVECAITGVPDEVRGQVIKATIVLAPEYRDREPEALKKEIQNHVKRVTAPYKYPRIVEFVDALPKTISGKIRRTEIREKDQK